MDTPENTISPKVKLPAIALAAIGVALVVIGYLINDHTVAAAGWSALGSSGIVGGLGFKVTDPLRQQRGTHLRR